MKTLLLLCIVGTVLLEVYGATREMTIGEATTYCEREVPNYCISTTCPQYCNSLRSQASKTRCNNECSKENRCKLKPTVGADSNTNAALDAQSRDQLWACIAEQRDPNNTKTGRRTTPWRQLRTPSFTRAVRP